MSSLRAKAGVRWAVPLILAAVLGTALATRSVFSEEELVPYADRLFSRAYPDDEPGAAVLVMRDGQVVLREGYGLANVERGEPIRPDMVFKLASVTKPFTAAAILLLQERGKLSVEDEVTRYLPDYPTHGHKITLHHLLTHTSGIPSFTELPEWQAQVREDITPAQLIAFFKDKPLEFSPGEKWSYNNSGYALLGAIIEKVSGKSYEDFIEQEIFAPLGMKRSRYGNRAEVVPGQVEGYERESEEEDYRVARTFSMTQPYAAGALESTVDDLALFAEALSSEKLLTRASLERMATPATLTSGQSAKYGYGLGVSQENGIRLFEHGGDLPGVACHFLYAPDKRLLVLVLSNNSKLEPGADVLAYRVAMKALGRPLESRKGIDLDPGTLDEYVGDYRFDGGVTRSISRRGRKLYARRDGGDETRILATSRDDFFYPDSDSRLRFRRNAQGKITGMEFLQRYGADMMGRKTAGAG